MSAQCLRCRGGDEMESREVAGGIEELECKFCVCTATEPEEGRGTRGEAAVCGMRI